MILVVGCGFVGETVAKSLEENGKEVVRIDPKLNNNKIHDYPKAKGAIVCVPTPTVDGRCDDSIIREVLEELRDIKVLLKCTVPPDMLATYPDNVTYNPEFLRANTAKEDWDKQKHFILGGSPQGCHFWRGVFSYLNVFFFDVDRATASMIKYVHNSWLATKVAFFHEMKNNLDNSYNHDKMIDILGLFENIGPSHMKAPNEDGGLGFGGHCFPKDTEAFYDYSKSEILKTVIEVNKKLRKE